MEHYLEKLRQGGLKLTPRRKAILDLFVDSKHHLTPEEVWETLSKQFKRCGLPSVYRNIESFVECGVLTRIQQFDRKKHYGLCAACHSDKHHHHIVCIKCGRVDEIENCALENKKRLKGYTIIRACFKIHNVVVASRP